MTKLDSYNCIFSGHSLSLCYHTFIQHTNNEITYTTSSKSRIKAEALGWIARGRQRMPLENKKF